MTYFRILTFFLNPAELLTPERQHEVLFFVFIYSARKGSGIRTAVSRNRDVVRQSCTHHVLYTERRLFRTLFA